MDYDTSAVTLTLCSKDREHKLSYSREMQECFRKSTNKDKSENTEYT